jgi:hypothetical protein
MFLCLFVPMFLYTAKSIYSSNEAADSKQNRTEQDRTEEVVKTVQNRTGHCRTLRNIAEHSRAEICIKFQAFQSLLSNTEDLTFPLLFCSERSTRLSLEISQNRILCQFSWKLLS